MNGKVTGIQFGFCYTEPLNSPVHMILYRFIIAKNQVEKLSFYF